MGKLSIEAVTELMESCLLHEKELPKEREGATFDAWLKDNRITVRGIVHSFAFNKEFIEKHRDEIFNLIHQLPNSFKDGMSFLNMCMNQNGEQWGEHPNAEELACLGIAAGVMIECSPFEMRPMLPGGMPYYQIRRKTV